MARDTNGSLTSLLVAALMIAGCDPRRGPGQCAEALIRALDQHDQASVAALEVSPALLARIVACPTGTKSTWWTAAGRQQWLAEASMRDQHAAQADMRIALESFGAEDQSTQWKAHHVGDVIGDRCLVKVAFDEEKYRIVLAISDFTSHDNPRHSSKPMELWRIDGAWFAWSDPWDTDVP